jgi:hypothetical protein
MTPFSNAPILYRLALALLLMAGALTAAAEESKSAESKEAALARLSASHDPEIPIAIGRVVVKQAALKAIRVKLVRAGRVAGFGADWNSAAVQWRTAEQQLAKSVDELIALRLQDPTWFREGWARAAAGVLNAQEADEIATHFQTEGGREQRVVVELLLIGETVLANYTFTDRIDYGMKGSEAEIRSLQDSWWAHEPFRERELSRHPNVVRFAGENPGIKYTRMLAIQGVEVITRQIDSTAAEAVRAVEAADVGPYIESHRAGNTAAPR